MLPCQYFVVFASVQLHRLFLIRSHDCSTCLVVIVFVGCEVIYKVLLLYVKKSCNNVSITGKITLFFRSSFKKKSRSWLWFSSLGLAWATLQSLSLDLEPLVLVLSKGPCWYHCSEMLNPPLVDGYLWYWPGYELVYCTLFYLISLVSEIK